ncbi:MAG: hypothetical protein HN909_01270 [Phycisphaerales bacterium]|nr:hypothetical protein [Phycisphaerales bacterium]MBT7170380.1 hypothetical protein [Phycisphaerales bacterium]
MSDANNNPLPGMPKMTLVGNMMRLLSAGLLGTILFVVLFILLIPVLLLLALYAWIWRWRLQRAVRKMAKEHEAMFREGVREAGYAEAESFIHGEAIEVDADAEGNPAPGRRKINVTVTTVKTEPDDDGEL